jgi:hypothetical protein
VAKLNCDGSLNPENGNAEAGMVLRDEEEHAIFSPYRQLIHRADSLEVEAWACNEVLSLVLQCCDKRILVNLDCSPLVDPLMENSHDRSSLSFPISYIKELVLSERIISFVKVDHTQNRVSHCLANFTRVKGRTDIWHRSVPACLFQVLHHDKFVIPIE